MTCYSSSISISTPPTSRAPEALARILADCRNFRLHLGPAHQTLSQIDSELLKGALENAQVKVVFGVGRATAHTLAPSDEEKIGAFCQAWYRAQFDLHRLTHQRSQERAAQGDDLRELASNPMLLTTMAMIHQGEIGLPSERVRLYSLAVDVLLRRWQRRKVTDQDGDEELASLLRDDRALTLLGDLPRLRSYDLAARLLDYVDQRAGLLLGRGGREGQPTAYSFAHRTFQEYLAGCHMVSLPELEREVWQHVGQGDDWQLATLRGAEELHYITRRGDMALLDLTYGLCCHDEPDSDAQWRASLWSGQMAALLGADAIRADLSLLEGGIRYLGRLLPRLVQLLRESRLTARERADAGNALACLGDP